MALKKCKECGNEISTKAESCPNCGAILKKKTGCLGYIGAGILIIFIFSVIGTLMDDNLNKSTSSSSSNPKEIAAEETACKKELQCWGDKHNVAAGVYCKDYVEKMAKYSHEWTDGMLELKFSDFRWLNQEQGLVTYIGDKIKFQNGFGAWQNMVYECDFNPANNQILDSKGSRWALIEIMHLTSQASGTA